MKKALIELWQEVGPVLPALAGGIVDYINQIQKGTKRWSLANFIIHLCSAAFFGWVCGTVAMGFDYSPNLVVASSGAGGFFGVRVADLITYKVFGDRRS